MRLLAFFAFVVMFLMSSAQAEDVSLIQIIRDDGSVSKYEIPEEAVNAPVSSIEIKPKARPEASQEEKKRQSKLNPVYKQREKEPQREPEIVRKVKEKKVVKKSRKAKVKKQAKWIGPPLPARKPLLQPKVMKTARDLPEGRAIPEGMAVSIAIKNAPPAKDFKVLRRMHRDKPVYAVVFKTDKGETTVLVDAKSGKIVSSKVSRQ